MCQQAAVFLSLAPMSGGFWMSSADGRQGMEAGGIDISPSVSESTAVKCVLHGDILAVVQLAISNIIPVFPVPSA